MVTALPADRGTEHPPATVAALLAALVALPPRRELSDVEAAALTAGRAAWNREQGNDAEETAEDGATFNPRAALAAVEAGAIEIARRALAVAAAARDPFAAGAAEALDLPALSIFTSDCYTAAEDADYLDTRRRADEGAMAVTDALEHAPAVARPDREARVDELLVLAEWKQGPFSEVRGRGIAVCADLAQQAAALAEAIADPLAPGARDRATDAECAIANLVHDVGLEWPAALAWYVENGIAAESHAGAEAPECEWGRAPGQGGCGRPVAKGARWCPLHEEETAAGEEPPGPQLPPKVDAARVDRLLALAPRGWWAGGRMTLAELRQRLEDAGARHFRALHAVEWTLGGSLDLGDPFAPDAYQRARAAGAELRAVAEELLGATGLLEAVEQLPIALLLGEVKERHGRRAGRCKADCCKLPTAPGEALCTWCKAHGWTADAVRTAGPVRPAKRTRKQAVRA